MIKTWKKIGITTVALTAILLVFAFANTPKKVSAQNSPSFSASVIGGQPNSLPFYSSGSGSTFGAQDPGGVSISWTGSLTGETYVGPDFRFGIQLGESNSGTGCFRGTDDNPSSLLVYTPWASELGGNSPMAELATQTPDCFSVVLDTRSNIVSLSSVSITANSGWCNTRADASGPIPGCYLNLNVTRTVTQIPPEPTSTPGAGTIDTLNQSGGQTSPCYLSSLSSNCAATVHTNITSAPSADRAIGVYINNWGSYQLWLGFLPTGNRYDITGDWIGTSGTTFELWSVRLLSDGSMPTNPTSGTFLNSITAYGAFSSGLISANPTRPIFSSEGRAPTTLSWTSSDFAVGHRGSVFTSSGQLIQGGNVADALVTVTGNTTFNLCDVASLLNPTCGRILSSVTVTPIPLTGRFDTFTGNGVAIPSGSLTNCNSPCQISATWSSNSLFWSEPFWLDATTNNPWKNNGTISDSQISQFGVGTYTFCLKAADGFGVLSPTLGCLDTKMVNVVQATNPDFLFSASPGSRTATVGGPSVTYTLTVTSTGGFSGQVSFAPSVLAGSNTGIVLEVTPSTVNLTSGGTQQAILTARAGTATLPSTYTISVGASGPGGLPSHGATLTLSITASSPRISVSPIAHTFVYPEGINLPLNKSFQISNIGSGVMNYAGNLLTSPRSALLNPKNDFAAEPFGQLAKWVVKKVEAAISPLTGAARGGDLASGASISATATGTISSSLLAANYKIVANNPLGTISETCTNSTCLSPLTNSITLVYSLPSPTANITADGSSGGVTVAPGDQVTIAWNSTYANAANPISNHQGTGFNPGQASSGVATITATQGGIYSITVRGLSNMDTSTANFATANVAVNVQPVAGPTFSLSVTPTSQTASPGTSRTYTISAIPQNGFNSQISLVASNPGSGITTSLGANSISPNGSTLLTVNTAATTAPNTYSINVTGSGGGITSIGTAQLVIPSVVPTSTTFLALSCTNNCIFSGTQGAANPTSQTLTVRNQASGTLNWTLSKDAFWLSLSNNSGSLGAGASSNVTLSANTTGLPGGIYTAAVTATGNASNSPQIYPVTLNLLTGGPRALLNCSPSNCSINQGQSIQFINNSTP